jgi:hypothetical protein
LCDARAACFAESYLIAVLLDVLLGTLEDLLGVLLGSGRGLSIGGGLLGGPRLVALATLESGLRDGGLRNHREEARATASAKCQWRAGRRDARPEANARRGVGSADDPGRDTYHLVLLGVVCTRGLEGLRDGKRVSSARERPSKGWRTAEKTRAKPYATRKKAQNLEHFASVTEFHTIRKTPRFYAFAS